LQVTRCNTSNRARLFAVNDALTKSVNHRSLASLHQANDTSSLPVRPFDLTCLRAMDGMTVVERIIRLHHRRRLK
jgi:hypothetical protein